MISAAGWVKTPSASSAPPINSIAPANQNSENGAGADDGQPKSFDVPCSKKSKAATIRRMLSILGAHRAAVSAMVMDGGSLDRPNTRAGGSRIQPLVPSANGDPRDNDGLIFHPGVQA